MRKFLFICLSLLAVSGLMFAQNVDLKGKKIEMKILGIGGWFPSSLGVEMAPLFNDYAKKNYGYEVSFSLDEAPFETLYQKAASSLATKSDEYNIIISDSQWLGAFAKPGWIVKLNDIIDKTPELKAIKWYNDVVSDTYMNYPQGTKALYGFPQEGDVMVLYVRKDMVEDPKEQAAFKAKYGIKLPSTFDDFAKLSMEDFQKVTAFFTRPDKGLYGFNMHTSKVYDYVSGAAYNWLRSLGGEIWDAKTSNVWGILNTPANVKAFDSYLSMFKYMPPGSTDVQNGSQLDLWNNGKVFSTFMWAAVGSFMQKVPTMIVPLPKLGKDGKRIASMGGQPWVINAFNDKEHMQVAIDFMKWWYMDSTQVEFAKRGGNPCTAAALNNPALLDMTPQMRAYKYMLPLGRDFWHDPMYSEMLAVQQEAWSAVITGQVKNSLDVFNYIAYTQQKILFEAGSTKTPPPSKVYTLK